MELDKFTRKELGSIENISAYYDLVLREVGKTGD